MTDSDLEQLQGLTELEFLYLEANNISDAAAEALREKLPGVHVFWQGPGVWQGLGGGSRPEIPQCELADAGKGNLVADLVSLGGIWPF